MNCLVCDTELYFDSIFFGSSYEERYYCLNNHYYSNYRYDNISLDNFTIGNYIIERYHNIKQTTIFITENSVVKDILIRYDKVLKYPDEFPTLNHLDIIRIFK